MIQLHQVSKIYPGNSKVLDHINLQVKKGEFLYLVGGSGAGKSTFLKIVATEESPSTGTVSLFGYSLNRVAPSTLRAIRRVVGYVPQDVRLIPDLTISENVSLALTLGGMRVITPEARKRVDDLLEVMGLSSKKNKLAQALSGGEAQRVAVARALVRNPELLLADEPTGAQDREFTWSLIELFVRSNLKGTTVLVATHDREIVRKVRKNCVVLKEGSVFMEDGRACFY